MRFTLVCFSILSISITSGWGGDPAYSGKDIHYDKSVVEDSPWQFEMSLPFHAAWMEATIAVQDITMVSNYGFDEAIKDLQGIAALDFLVKYDRLGYKFSFFWMELGIGEEFTDPNFLDSVGLDLMDLRFEQFLSYDVIKNDRFTVTLGGGARYKELDLIMRVKGGPRGGIARDANPKLWDAVGMGEVRYQVNEDVFLRVYGDCGGSDSDTNWRLIAGGGVQLNERTYMTLDYRHDKHVFSNGNVSIDLVTKGPQLALHVQF